MRSLRVLLAAALAVGLPLIATGVVKAELKLGVVDIVEVTNKYDRTKDASADLQVEQANLKAGHREYGCEAVAQCVFEKHSLLGQAL